MRRLFTSLVAVVALCAPAVACINDSELPGHEREFRSSYGNGRAPSESPAQGWQAYAPTALYAAGATLLFSGGFVTLRRLIVKG